MFKSKYSYDAPILRKPEKYLYDLNDVELSQKEEVKHNNWRNAVSETWHDYCSSTSVHGLKYLGEEQRTLLEKLFWICSFILSIYFCSQLIHNVWQKWEETPVIVSFSEKPTPVWEIPFPAITICPETKTQQKLFNFTKLYWDLLINTDPNVTIGMPHTISKADFDYLRALFQVCESYLLEDFTFGTYDDIDIVGLLQSVAPNFNLTYPYCKWRNVVGTCEALFFKVITEEGICYTFNGLNALELYRESTVNYNLMWKQQTRRNLQWSLQGGYEKAAGTDTYPARVLGAGARPGIFLVLQGFDYNTDYICRGPIQGFKVLLHSPDDVPQLSKQYVRVPFEKEVLLAVKPNMIKTSNSLSSYRPHRRQCYFSEERYLRYFNVYTQSNCELECLANYTLDKCGCVKFSMPRVPSIPVCDVSHIMCYQEAEDHLLRDEFIKGLEASENDHGKTNCDCLPSCTSLSYSAEISQADFNLLSLLDAYNDTYMLEFPGVKMSRLSVFFKENHFITSQRAELYGLTDFLANCGGLLGLFIGMSFFSLVELLYFCPIRIFCNILKYKREQKGLKEIEVKSVAVIEDAA